MSDYFDYGPLRTYEITWKSGHVETVQGHQVMFESMGFRHSAGLFGSTATGTSPPKFMIHGEFGGHWRFVVAGLESELVSLRDVTERETLSGGAP